MYIKFTFITTAAGHYQLDLEDVELIPGEPPEHLPENTLINTGDRDLLVVVIPGKDSDVTVEKIFSHPYLKRFLAEPKQGSPPGGAAWQEDKLASVIKRKLEKLIPSQGKETKEEPSVVQLIEEDLWRKIAKEKDCREAAKLRVKFLTDPYVLQITCAQDVWSQKYTTLILEDKFKFDTDFDVKRGRQIEVGCPRNKYWRIHQVHDTVMLIKAYRKLIERGLKELSRHERLTLQQDERFYRQFQSEIDASLAEDAPGMIKPPPTTPLMQAAHKGDLAKLQTLLAQGVNVNEFHETHGRQQATALHYAVASDEYKDEETRFKVIQALLEHKADLEAKDRFCFTPLRHAHSPAVAQFLLKQGAQPLSELLLCCFLRADHWRGTARGNDLACFFVDQHLLKHGATADILWPLLYGAAETGDQTAPVFKKMLPLYVQAKGEGADHKFLLDLIFQRCGVLNKAAASSLLATYHGSADFGRPLLNKLPEFVSSLCNSFEGSSPQKIISQHEAFMLTLKALVQHPFFNRETSQDALRAAHRALDKGAIRAALVAAQEGRESTTVKINIQKEVMEWHQQFLRNYKGKVSPAKDPTSISSALRHRIVVDESKRDGSVSEAKDDGEFELDTENGRGSVCQRFWRVFGL